MGAHKTRASRYPRVRPPLRYMLTRVHASHKIEWFIRRWSIVGASMGRSENLYFLSPAEGGKLRGIMGRWSLFLWGNENEKPFAGRTIVSRLCTRFVSRLHFSHIPPPVSNKRGQVGEKRFKGADEVILVIPAWIIRAPLVSAINKKYDGEDEKTKDRGTGNPLSVSVFFSFLFFSLPTSEDQRLPSFPTSPPFLRRFQRKTR